MLCICVYCFLNFSLFTHLYSFLQYKIISWNKNQAKSLKFNIEILSFNISLMTCSKWHGDKKVYRIKHDKRPNKLDWTWLRVIKLSRMNFVHLLQNCIIRMYYLWLDELWVRVRMLYSMMTTSQNKSLKRFCFFFCCLLDQSVYDYLCWNKWWDMINWNRQF